MPHYHKSGLIPHKRHTQFRKPNGELYSEQLFSTEGFSSDSSLLYHTHPPTQIIKTENPYSVMPEVAEEKMLKHRSFQGFNIKHEDDYIKSRIPVLVNNDCHISLAAPAKSMEDYTKKMMQYACLTAELYYGQKKKQNWFRAYGGPAFTFVKNYVFLLGFLDGSAGFTLAKIISMYTYVKYKRLRRLYKNR